MYATNIKHTYKLQQVSHIKIKQTKQKKKRKITKANKQTKQNPNKSEQAKLNQITNYSVQKQTT